MSIVPKVSIGRRTKREHSNLSQDTHTTMEVGYLQPTFCRHIVPGSHTEISIRNIVRLSAMNVPTMGRLSLRNYIHFVDFSTLWSPFSAFKERTNYTYADGYTYIPTSIPYFTVGDMFRHMFQSTDPSSNDPLLWRMQQDIVCSCYKNGTIINDSGTLGTALSKGINHSGVSYINRFWTGSSAVMGTTNITGSTSRTVTCSNFQFGNTWHKAQITRLNSDFSFRFTDGSDVYMIYGKFYGRAKRLRSIFLGCGYSFNPYDGEKVTWLKLLAVYKAYFDRFGISRTTNFLNTNCYKFIKFTSENRFADYNMYTQNGDYCDRFLADLADICYTLPPDYFSVADTMQFRSVDEAGGPLAQMDLYDQYTNVNDPAQLTTLGAEPGVGAKVRSSAVSSVAIKAAMRLLPYVNKQSVIGRKLSELLKADGIEDVHNDQHELTHKLGATRTDISIDDVMSFAGTEDNSLGDFAGRGVGSNRGAKIDRFFYDNKQYGCLLVLSCVVPVSGYFQGILKENSDGIGGPFDFFTSDFDCIGYQAVKANELVSDLQFQNYAGNSQIGTALGNWGVLPRYSHLKVGFNRCMGDISLPSTQDVMLPYTFDRHFLTKVVESGTNADFKAVYAPVNEAESFRKIQGASGYGDYNRIFQYVNGDFDHFICQFVFDCDTEAPMRSMRESFDTYSDADNTAFEVAHE